MNLYNFAEYKRYAFTMINFKSQRCVLCDKVYKQRIPQGNYRGAYSLVRANLRAANQRDKNRHYKKAHPEIRFDGETIIVDKIMAEIIDAKRSKK
jgi:hypothetical protein